MQFAYDFPRSPSGGLPPVRVCDEATAARSLYSEAYLLDDTTGVLSGLLTLREKITPGDHMAIWENGSLLRGAGLDMDRGSSTPGRYRLLIAARRPFVMPCDSGKDIPVDTIDGNELGTVLRHLIGIGYTEPFTIAE